MNTQSCATGDRLSLPWGGLTPKPISGHRIPTGHREPSLPAVPPLRGPSVVDC